LQKRSCRNKGQERKAAAAAAAMNAWGSKLGFVAHMPQSFLAHSFCNPREKRLGIRSTERQQKRSCRNQEQERKLLLLLLLLQSIPGVKIRVWCSYATNLPCSQFLKS
jgi:hypothetical protein